jgi:hypothetical protein
MPDNHNNSPRPWTEARTQFRDALRKAAESRVRETGLREQPEAFDYALTADAQ